jgi:Uma2 family endonuclease
MYPRFYPPGSHWAIAGGTAAHARICRELGRLVANHLLDGPCESYAADLLVAIDPERDYYPDLVVVCGDQPSGGERRLYDATLIVEVLSRSTARLDRGRKFRAYQELESLEEYMLVDSRRRRVEVFRCDAHWERVAAATGGDVTLASISITLDLDALYDRARIAPA